MIDSVITISVNVGDDFDATSNYLNEFEVNFRIFEINKHV